MNIEHPHGCSVLSPERWDVRGGAINDILQGSDEETNHEEEVHDDVVVVPEGEVALLEPDIQHGQTGICYCCQIAKFLAKYCN